MGCDIHVNFETRDANGEWSLTFKRVPDKDYWWEYILEAKIEDGSGAVMTGSNDPAVLGNFLEDHFKSLTEEQIIERYGDHPAMNWDKCLPCLEQDAYAYPEVRRRNYDFFEKIAGVRGEYALFPILKGVPGDSCHEVKDDVESYSEGHSHSWLMVSEMTEHPRLKDFIQIRWMKSFIADPENTRMVFYFDC